MITRLKRIVPLLLLSATLIFSGSVSVYASENDDPKFVDAFIVFADLHTDKSNIKTQEIKEMIAGAQRGMGYPVSTVNSAGDAFSVCADDDERMDFSKGYGDTYTINESIYDGLGDTSAQINYVWSDHDRYADVFYSTASDSPITSNKISHFIYGAGPDEIYGTEDDDNYYLYALSMADLAGPQDRYNSGFNYESERYKIIAEFKETALKLNDDKPLFIISHLPLFERRNDNYFAHDWFEAINEIALERDVAFFFGHNHSHDASDDYYIKKNSQIYVETQDEANNIGSNDYNTGAWETLNFSHFCAGYMDPGSNTVNETTRANVVMGVTIFEDTIVFQTYNKNGAYNGTLFSGADVKRDHVIAGPELSPQTTYQDSTGAVTLTFPTARRRDISIEKISTSDKEEIKKYLPTSLLLDMSTGYEISGATSVSAPFTVTLKRSGRALKETPAVYRVSKDGTVTRMTLTAVTDDSVSFTTDTFGQFFMGIARLPEETEKPLELTTVYETKTIYVPTRTIKNNGKYLIVGVNGKGGNFVAYTNNSGKEGVITVDRLNREYVTDTSVYSVKSIELNNAAAVWTATGNDSNGYIFENNGQYICTTDNITLGTSEGSVAYLKYDKDNYRLMTASGNTKYLYYSTYVDNNVPEYWNWSSGINSSSESSRQIWLFEEVSINLARTSTYGIKAPDTIETPYGGEKTLKISRGLTANGKVVDPYGFKGTFRYDIVDSNNAVVPDMTISDKGEITFHTTDDAILSDCYIKITFTWQRGSCHKYVRLVTNSNYNHCRHSYAENTTPNEDNSNAYICVRCGTHCKSGTYIVDTFREDIDIDQTVGSFIEPSVPSGNTASTPVYKEKTVYVPVDSFENGEKYMIIGEDNVGGRLIAHINNGGHEGYAYVTVNMAPLVTDTTTYTEGYIELNNSNAVWTATGNASSGYKLKNNGGYLGGEYGNTVMSSSSQAAKVTYDAAADRLFTVSGNKLYLYYSTYGDENWKWSSSANSSTSSRQMWIYKEVTVKVATSDTGSTVLPEPTPTPKAPSVIYIDKTIFVPVNSFEDGGEYLVVGEDNVGGRPIAHVNNGGYEGYAYVTVNMAPLVTDTITYTEGYIELNNSNAVWTSTGNASSGYKLKNNGGYLGGEYGNTVMSSSSQAAKVTYDAATDRLFTVSGNKLYLYYSTYGDENWKWSSSANSSTSSRQMWIYKKVTVKVAQ